MFRCAFTFFVFVLLLPQYFAIFDPSKWVTKPPSKKETLPWPTETTTKIPFEIEKKSQITATKPPMVKEQLPWPTFNDKIERSSNQQFGSSYSPTSKQNNNQGKNADLRNSWVFPKDDAPEDRNWDKTGWIPSQPCPEMATGQFPYPGDCRKFYNCWKGRGVLQICSPGTLFNPEKLECDFPSKVNCLPTTGHYSPVPVVDNNDPGLADGQRNSKLQDIYLINLDRNGGNEPNKPRQTFAQNSGITNGQSIPNQPSNVNIPIVYHPNLPEPYSQYPAVEVPLQFRKPGSLIQCVKDPGETLEEQQHGRHHHHHPHHHYPHARQSYGHHHHHQHRSPSNFEDQSNHKNPHVVCFNITNGESQQDYSPPTPNIQPPFIPNPNYQPSFDYNPNNVKPGSYPEYKPQTLAYNQNSQNPNNVKPGQYPQNGPSLFKPSDPYMPQPSGNQPTYNNPQTSFPENSGYPPIRSIPSKVIPGSKQPSNYPSYENPTNSKNEDYAPPVNVYPQPNQNYYPQNGNPQINPNYNINPGSQYPPVNFPNAKPFENPYNHGSPNTPYNNPRDHGMHNSPQVPPSNPNLYNQGYPNTPYNNPSDRGINNSPQTSPSNSNPYSQGNPNTPYNNPRDHGINNPPNSNPYNQRNPNTPYNSPRDHGNPHQVPPLSTNPYNQGNPNQPNIQNPYSNLNPVPNYPSNPSPPSFNPQQQNPNANKPNFSPSSETPTQNNQNRERSGKMVKCPAGYSGLLPHPEFCEKFLNCDHGRTFIQQCGPGTAFNPTFSVCDYPANVDCDHSDVNNGNSDTPDHGRGDNADRMIPVVVREGVDNGNSNTPIVDNGRGDNGNSDIPELESRSGGNEYPNIDNFGQDSQPIPTYNFGYSNPKPNSLVENIDTNDKTNQGKGKPYNAKQPSQAVKPHETEKPVVPQTEKSNDNPNFRHPRIPGHYIVTNITTTPASPSESEEVPSSSESSKPLPFKPLSHIAEVHVSRAPVSRQLVRLRGGTKPSEGFLEMQLFLPGWGIVCDKENSWTMQEANIVCKQLGYERGSELTWQGRPSEGHTVALKTIAADVVNCTGNEHSLIDCQLENDNTCDPERHSVWIRCFPNIMSYCQPGEASFDGKCYMLVVPKEDKTDDTVGFSQGEALAHCQTKGGHLFDINSQKENDHVSEWLLSQNLAPSVMTAGVGVSLLGRSLWFWEGSADTLDYHNWWPGWGQIKGTPPATHTGRGLCVVARHQFPCPGSSGAKSNAEASLCDAEYFFWDAEDCGVMSSKHPYVCERKADKIGCIVGNGKDYLGPANVTETGTSCLNWESDVVLPALQYRISESTRQKSLTNHNRCRNVGGTDSKPWCFVRTATGIKKEHCDIPSCLVQGTGKSGNDEAFKCGDNQFTCGINDCIPSSWVCDGQPDCKNGLDETKCSKNLNKFTDYQTARLNGHDREKWLKTSTENCAAKCLQAKNFTCYSFSYNLKDETCVLSDSNIGMSGHLIDNESNWNYYEVTSLIPDCSELYQCENKKCINKTLICDGRNDCGDRSDEHNCTAINDGFAIKLVGGKTPNEGRIEIRVLGVWGLVCDDMFGLRDADVVCREAGFSLGASEVKLHSAFAPSDKKPLFLVDDLDCIGNETSIRDCDFNGWGVHDCGPEEVVGVVCKVPGATCPQNYWQCEGSKECIPVEFLCDNTADCKTRSDEAPSRCNASIEVRLVGGKKNSGAVSAGRVEIKRYGIWGTVCDDDFGPNEAAVVCKSLGFKGDAEVKKEAAFGPGEGVIWLDQVRCNGSESGVDKCIHQQWGQTNCKHNEDVSVICSNWSKHRKETQKPSKHTTTKALGVKDDETNELTDILPRNCGTLSENLDIRSSDFTAKVVEGLEIQKGTYPWQASIRVRAALKSMHWCGAVVISSLHILTAGHCLVDYIKDVYFVRVGDHDSEIEEGTEQEADIEEIYLHEDFNKGVNMNNDLALIKLKGRGLILNTWVRPICLPTSPESYDVGLNCTTSGWGSNGSPGGGNVRKLHATWLPILSQNVCSADHVHGKVAITNGMFCAGRLSGGSDSCQGDSGGPFICSFKDRFTLFGITSWGLGCGRINKPGVYTKINQYVPWLKDKLQTSMTD